MAITFLACQKESPTDPDPEKLQIGKNAVTTQVDGLERKYIVQVPATYDEKTASPVVFMLHGTTGDGEKFYQISGWKELGEKENVITIFPSSLAYCYVEDGKQKTNTKWHSSPGDVDYCNENDRKDDVKFLRQIVLEVSASLKINPKRIYIVGFSSGGQMALKAGLEASDLFAAAIEASGTATAVINTKATQQIPIGLQIGNSDPLFFQNPIHLSNFDDLLNTSFFKQVIDNHANGFGYKKNFTITGDTTRAVIANFEPIPSSKNNFFILLIKNMDHIYPNGVNFPFNGAQVHWDWFKQYSKS
ncbi:MAG TPA: alpha/beta hydrolase-fold protein [Saprospiraceae bacterium]|nr:alpha/beta hydrolase-fold protein [Saprospiraceae bacterium]HPN69083.1 alpha/beta hydrolase-fold protein [Saprospiraceae bacterium]